MFFSTTSVLPAPATPLIYTTLGVMVLSGLTKLANALNPAL
jgi:hypothetical protein|uniref:Uncharacterized protein n=1 Tax=virus sp. ctML55 TaxID=2827627 RepID=A0A8S5RII4_9VIRU|nr:MAG TPA: hypothetical protein [virus sp. ctML55]